MPRIQKNGTLFTSIRLTPEEAMEMIINKLEEDGIEVPMPDFGEGEGDSLTIEIRPNDSNATEASLVDGFELVLVAKDSEDDPATAPDPEA